MTGRQKASKHLDVWLS